jgi:Na+-driven multidrug efflux pump
MECISIGVGPFLVNAANCIVVMFINQQLLKYDGELAIGAYGIQNRIAYFFLMIAAGVNQGLQPIAGYNFGARLYSRVRKVYWTAIGWVSVATVAGFIICEAFPTAAVSLFTNDPTLREMSARALRVCNIMLPVIGFHMVTTQLFQCLGMVGKGIILSLSRQILIMLPLLYILPLFMGSDGVWATFPTSDFLSFLLALGFLFWLMGKMKKLNDGDDPAILGSSL